jgi:hypothetical protein
LDLLSNIARATARAFFNLFIRGNIIMPLHEVGLGKDTEILAVNLENSLINNYNVGRFDKRTYDKMCRTIDTELASLQPTANSKMIWTKAGALVGHSSAAPHRDLNHLWESAIPIFGENKTLLKFIGTLVMWRISLREDIWLVYREDSGKVDEDTGERIRICTYWIDNDYVNPNRKPTAADLLEKFNIAK